MLTPPFPIQLIAMAACPTVKIKEICQAATAIFIGRVTRRLEETVIGGRMNKTKYKRDNYARRVRKEFHLPH